MKLSLLLNTNRGRRNNNNYCRLLTHTADRWPDHNGTVDRSTMRTMDSGCSITRCSLGWTCRQLGLELHSTGDNTRYSPRIDPQRSSFGDVGLKDARLEDSGCELPAGMLAALLSLAFATVLSSHSRMGCGFDCLKLSAAASAVLGTGKSGSFASSHCVA